MKDRDEERLLFVYGSLKRGQSNHGQLGRADYVAFARTAPRFALSMFDGYPALVPGSRAVLGELYRIAAADLLELDAFEGPDYRRAEIELEGGGRALAYLALEPSKCELYPADQWPAP